MKWRGRAMSDWLLRDNMELVNLATGATIQLNADEQWDRERSDYVLSESQSVIEHRTPGIVSTLFAGKKDEMENRFFDMVDHLEAQVAFIKDSLTVEWWRQKLKERGLT